MTERRLTGVGATSLVGVRTVVRYDNEATVALDDLLDRVEAIAAEPDEQGVEYEMSELGAMAETPASTFLAREFVDRLDFLSIGTNDLVQYVMATARDDERVPPLHDPLHPTALRAIARTVEAGHEGDARVGVCGEMAGDPKLTALLVGLGPDALTLSAVTAPDAKENHGGTEFEEATAVAEAALRAETRDEVREATRLTAVVRGFLDYRTWYQTRRHRTSVSSN